MARTVKEIYDEMVVVKSQQPELNDLSSTSDTALWKLFLYINSMAISVMEQLYDLLKVEVEYIRETTPSNTRGWFVDKLLNFYQYNTDSDKGVLKISENFIPYYTTPDEASKIIKFCSVTQTKDSRRINIKVTKAGNDGLPTQLNNNEILSVEEFISGIKGAGLLTNVVSLPADEAVILANVIIDGGYIEADVRAECITAIEDFFKNLSTENFTGDVSKTKIIDVIQRVEGVLDVDSTNFKLKCRANGQTNYEDVEVFYSTLAGYIFLDTNQTLLSLSIKK